MANTVKPIPDGYHTVTPYLTVAGAAKLIDYLKQGFGATETFRHNRPDGAVGHAEVKIGDSPIMLAEAGGEFKAKPANLFLYVTDVDAVYKRAIQAGGASLGEPTTQFYGDRTGGVQDPCGNTWWIGTHVEDVAPEELERRAKAAGR